MGIIECAEVILGLVLLTVALVASLFIGASTVVCPLVNRKEGKGLVGVILIGLPAFSFAALILLNLKELIFKIL